ncbi:putative protein Brevis radix-like 5 [Phragmites australis]|uniref:putative protein Brevis radix-like 5 n=1 Tax=Phragmites australis TaxID=29695 RepID=UPI002D77843E|nr:putative protein Brevis radix-like 5 [Phragmites australis]
MHACFHGGGNSSRITKSIGIIRDLTKSMKTLSLKAKVGGGGGSRARARRRRRRPAEDEELQLHDKDVAAAASAKIAPAQPQEADGGDHKDHHQHEEEEHGGEKHEHCDKCCSPLDDDGAGEDGEGAAATAGTSDREWVAEPEPGVLMTLVPRADGTNHLRRIQFSKELFGDAWEAQSWWEDNYDRVVELYSIVQSEHSHDEEEVDDDDDPAPVTPCQSEDDEHQRQSGTGSLEYLASCSASASGGSTSNFSGPSSGSGGGSANTVDSPILGLITEAISSTEAAQAHHSQTTRQVTLTEEVDTCSSI